MQTASPPAAPEAGTSADPSAVIAAARARARRRRLRTALAAGIAVAAVGGGLIASVIVTGSRPAPRIGPPHPVPLAAGTGRVTGHIDVCAGAMVPGRQLHAAGTVTALRGRYTWKDDGRGTRKFELPTTVAARQHVGECQSFSLSLAVGQYVLVAPDGGPGDLSFVEVTVTAGRVLHQDLPNLCK
jgi:hypothetical protein